jgi:hypothetical protein
MGDLNKPGDEKLSNFRSDDFKFWWDLRDGVGWFWFKVVFDGEGFGAGWGALAETFLQFGGGDVFIFVLIGEVVGYGIFELVLFDDF